MSRIVVGHHACREVFKIRPHSIDKMWIAENWEKSSKLSTFMEQAEWNQVTVLEKSDRALMDLSNMPQGVALFVSETPELNFAALKSDSPALILAIDEVTDPHNLGAILRTAWLMGVKAVFAPAKRCCPLSPAVHKVASGACEHIPVEYVSQLHQELKRLKEQGFWVFGLDHRGSKSLWGTELPEKLVWVLGSEGKGIRSSTEKSCDELVSLPQLDPEASYNVSVAAALAISEHVRQQNN